MYKAPAFQFYAQDFLTGCIYLTNEEIGMYIKMLCKQWTDGNIQIKRLEFLIGKTWENLSEELKAKFLCDGTFLINERMEVERQKMIEKSEKAKVSADKRWKKPLSDTKNKEKKPSMRTHDKRISESDAFLEDRSMKYEDEIEEEKRKKKKAGTDEKQLLTMPLEFVSIWNDWLTYRIAKRISKYASVKYEQMAVDKLLALSENNPQTALQIINRSIENNWNGFFELQKPMKNGTPSPKTGFKTVSDDYARKIAESLQSGKLS